MQILWKINLALLTLLGISTAAVKFARMPEEMRLFEAVGLSTAATIFLGAIQLLATALTLVPSSRRIGASLLIMTFLFATAALFVSKVHLFGFASLLFPCMAAFAGWGRLGGPAALAPHARSEHA